MLLCISAKTITFNQKESPWNWPDPRVEHRGGKTDYPFHYPLLSSWRIVQALIQERPLHFSGYHFISASDPNAARLKEYIVRIFYGNDSRILIELLPLISVWACRSGSRTSVASNENAPSQKHRAGKRIERLKGTAECLTADWFQAPLVPSVRFWPAGSSF